MMIINAHNLVGGSTKRCWTQGQCLAGEQSATLVLMLKMSESEGEIDLASIGGAIFERFQNYGSVYHTPIEWEDFINGEIHNITNEISISVGIASLYGNKIWLWGQGETNAILLRDEAKIQLVGSEGWLGGILGELKNGDVLLLGTQSGLEATILSINEFNYDSGINNYVEGLAPLIHQRVDQAEIVVMFLEVGAVMKDSSEQSQENLVVASKFPSIVVRRMGEEPHKLNLILGVGVCLLLLILVVIGVLVKNQRMTKAEYDEVMVRSSNMISEAEKVAESNPERAKILISQSNEVLDKYINSGPKTLYLKQAEEKLALIKQKEQEILKVRGIVLTSTVELSILADNLQSDRIVDDGTGSMYFWDDKTHSIVGIATKDLSKVSFPVESERFLRPFGVRESIYTGMTSSGVWQGSSKGQKVIISADEVWGEISQIATFGNNVYLLDTKLGEIWKYSATDEGYTERRRWLGKGIVLDLSRVIDWVVDGDIWLLTSSGKLEKYSRGVPVAFAMSGVPSGGENGLLNNPIAMTIVNDNIYLLERGAKRVIVMNIDGKYKQQYISEDFGRASDIMVYENKGYVLVDNVIKEWEL